MYLNLFRYTCRTRTFCHGVNLNVRQSYFCTNGSNNESSFIPIYKFPYIRAAGLVNRLKVYQSGVTLVALPGSIVLGNLGLISADSVITTFVLGITGTLSLFLFGIVPNKLVGFAYINEEDTTVKFSYLDFWGRRKDIEMPISDLMPLTDLPAIPTDPLYLTLRRFSTPKTLKINLKYGIVLEKSKFKVVFLQDVQ